ncbi:MAG: hypothetical protein GYA31_01375, partial [Parcubacteria group bacterium]|nr:hypothetical protein [Parcubacteria group bacterium]
FYLSLFPILIIGFIIASYVFGWTSPSAIPPGGTIYTPIDVSSSNQAKQGYLSIGTSTVPSYALDIYGVIRIGQFSSAPSGAIGSLYYDTTSNKFKGYTDSGWIEISGTGLWTASGTDIYYNMGNVGIGTSTPSAKLDIYSSTTPWNALGICKNGVCCPIWKDCDGDGKTYGNGDCDESCSTCYVGSMAYTTSPDGKDQDCDGVIDNPNILVVYMSSSTYNGNLGGRSGADSKCDLGSALGCLPGENRALINVSDSDEIQDMPVNYHYSTDREIYWYNRSNGSFTKLANNWADMCDGSILSTQLTGTGISGLPWSGNGSGCMLGQWNCYSWSTNLYSMYGTVGSDSLTDYQWLADANYPCSTTARVRCLCETTQFGDKYY